MSKAFASQADLEEKQVSFTKLSDHAYAYTAEGDPNTGIVIGDDAVMVIDTQATPAMAQDVIRRIREVTDKPIKFVVLSHYHAVRVLGASAYRPEHIIASQDTYDLIVERGEQDKASEIGRFPRLFRDAPSRTGAGSGRSRWTCRLRRARRSGRMCPGCDDVFGPVGAGAEHAHRVVVTEHDVLDRLVGDFADAADDVLRHRRRGLRVDHDHRVVADRRCRCSGRLRRCMRRHARKAS